MAELTIIKDNDIREFYPQLSANIDSKKIDASILKAQQTDLERFLGYYLYNEFIEDFAGQYTFNTPKYQRLFDGETYTFRNYERYFRGIRQLLSVYSFARIMGISDIHVTESGMVNKLSDESELRTEQQQRYDIWTVKDDYISLEQNAKEYIQTKRSDYPLYDKVYSTTDNKTSFNFYRI